MLGIRWYNRRGLGAPRGPRMHLQQQQLTILWVPFPVVQDWCDPWAAG